MKTKLKVTLATLAIALTPAVILLSQGPLTPPGPPGPTMKTLAQIEPRVPISTLPVVLSQPGAYYLTGNLTGVTGQAGIMVAADRVTIDLGGFVLSGVAGSLDGILVNSGQSHVTVIGGTVRSWGGTGVNAEGASNCALWRVVADGNGGAGLHGGDRAMVRDCVATGSGTVGIRVGYHGLVAGCTVSGNQQSGIGADGGGTIHDCLAMNNGGPGISAGDVSVFDGCTSRDNGGDGFYAGSGSVVGRCAATANGGTGVRTGLASTVTECSAKNNAGAGISVDDGTTVRDSVARQNLHGIEITSRCLILENNCSENANDGIYVTGSRNRIEANHLSENINGVHVAVGGDQNFIVRNTSTGENGGVGFALPGGGNTCPIVNFGAIGTAGPWVNFSDSTN